jgi:hypothetical protein
MILNSAPQNEAVLSNVGEIGEFRIRNSAKAFNILSSGLYSNKIRAIIRELSCNAVDSHVAAGKSDVPFDVHLPNVLAPHFSIRDYGTGLSHDQVTNIYTTYFESTKTGSNDFIGALGLGSKSPFSYTDNFTVTAIKDGRKGIYSAFINGEGVPSIALMMEEQTDEQNGVEIKFSVNDKHDFYKFVEEARTVYSFFKLKPNVTSDSFKIKEFQYETRDLIPGVHVYSDTYAYSTTVAVMGNIAYPIQVPNAEQTLGDLHHMLKCGLELHFEIGELDFQASREGLSYIPQTIESIKNKLVLVRDELTKHIQANADAISNFWERAIYLNKKFQNNLWREAVLKYVADIDFPLANRKGSYYSFIKDVQIDVEVLQSKYNMIVRQFDYEAHNGRCSNRKPSIDYRSGGPNTLAARVEYISFAPYSNKHFIVNDLNIGAVERAKYHYKNNVKNSSDVFVLERADKTKEMNTKQFFADIYNPPEEQIFNASDLDQKPRQLSMTRNVSILKLVRQTGRRYRENSYSWNPAGTVAEFDVNTTHYYIPLSGYNTINKDGYAMEAKDIQAFLGAINVDGLPQKIYGVRKTDIEAIKTQKNWVNIEDHLIQFFNSPTKQAIAMTIRDRVKVPGILIDGYHGGVRKSFTIENVNSPFHELIAMAEELAKIKSTDCASLAQLAKVYGKDPAVGVISAAQKSVVVYNSLIDRYKLLAWMRDTYSDSGCIAAASEYVNLIDKTKGI